MVRVSLIILLLGNDALDQQLELFFLKLYLVRNFYYMSLFIFIMFIMYNGLTIVVLLQIGQLRKLGDRLLENPIYNVSINAHLISISIGNKT